MDLQPSLQASLQPSLKNNCNDLFKKQVDVPHDFKNETYNAIALSSLTYHYLKNAKNLDKAIAEIQYQTTQTKNLVLNRTKEYIFFWEIFPSEEDLQKPIPDKIITTIARMHFNQNLVNKTAVMGQKELDELMSRLKSKSI